MYSGIVHLVPCHTQDLDADRCTRTLFLNYSIYSRDPFTNFVGRIRRSVRDTVYAINSYPHHLRSHFPVEKRLDFPYPLLVTVRTFTFMPQQVTVI